VIAAVDLGRPSQVYPAYVADVSNALILYPPIPTHDEVSHTENTVSFTSVDAVRILICVESIF
jgi:hypothetical protein